MIGSSLIVYPAAALPLLAVRSGCQLVILNFEPTPMDSRADVVIHARAGEIMPQIMHELRKSDQ